MITRSNLAEQLRDYQIRSQHKWASLTFFSATAQITSGSEAAKAGLWGLLFFALIIFSFISLYLRYTWLGFSFRLHDLSLLEDISERRKVQNTIPFVPLESSPQVVCFCQLRLREEAYLFNMLGLVLNFVSLWPQKLLWLEHQAHLEPYYAD
ncbi:hypothetical protein SUGI_0600220 [Cryptomeria japonica]|nr:hypothetical protein SUGI_0600220 [Cryptomeria japonica]